MADEDEIDGRTFMNEAAEAMEPWAPHSARELAKLAAVWAGEMPLWLGVAVVRGHSSPNWERLPAKLRHLGDPFPIRQIVGCSWKETLTLMFTARYL